MKRIFLCFAAVAALASCVKEKTLVPDQIADGLLTIKAVSTDTKTVLGDGAVVLWENNDAIKVVLKGTAGYRETEFTTTLVEKSEKADFKGTLDENVTADAYGEEGFAIYPADVVVDEKSERSRMQFVVEKVQDGKFQSGENLSYANISLEDLKANGEVNALFHNLLSLVKVTVPSGVKSVTLESVQLNPTDEITPLAGKAPFFYEDGVFAIDPMQWSDNEPVLNPDTDQFEQKPAKYYSLVLENNDSDLTPGDHYLHVFPGKHANLTITVSGEGFSYKKTIGQAFEFKASEYHSLNITDIFGLEETAYLVSPFGGDVEVSLFTTYDDYSVTIDQEWLEIVPESKGAFRKDVRVFTADPNTTSAERTAKVTIKVGEETIAEFNVTQKNYEEKLLNNFVETYTKQSQSQNGTLKIEMTDNASKGVYKVTICGVTVYADYEDGYLKLHDGKYDRPLSVSADFKTISSNNFTLSGTTISGYSAYLTLGAPDYTPEQEALLGRYTESWTYKTAASTNKGGMTIAASEDLAYGLYKIQFMNDGSSSYTGYANLSKDGKQLTIPVGKQQHMTFNQYGFVSLSDIVLTVEDNGSLTFDSWDSLNGKVTNYSAVKYVETPETPGEGGTVTAGDLVGRWHEKFTAGGPYENDLMTIALSDDPSKGQLKVNMFEYGTKPYKLVCYANLSQDGKTLTVLSNRVDYSGMGTFAEDMVMKVSNGGKKIEFDKNINTSYGQPVGTLTATKLNN